MLSNASPRRARAFALASAALAATLAFAGGADAATKRSRAAAPAAEQANLPTSDDGHPIVRPVTATDCIAAGRPDKPYYVEFRSRTAQSYGHTFVLHGRYNQRGFLSVNVAGLHPAGLDASTYTLGHVFPVPAETGPSWGDLDEQYMTQRFCVPLSADEYSRVLAYIRQLQATKKTWLATGYNCNTFGGDIARFMGLKVPNGSIVVPETYITGIREANINRRVASFGSSEPMQMNTSPSGP